MVHSPDSDTDFFDIVTGISQGDTLTSFQFKICLEYILWTSIDLMKEKVLILKKAKSKWYPAETTPDADYLDDLTFLANVLAQAESLEQASRSNGLYSDETNFLCFKRHGAASTLNDNPLKFVDSYTSVAISHQIKTISKNGQQRQGQLSIGNRLYGNLIFD